MCDICKGKKEFICPACKGFDPSNGCARCHGVGVIACPKCAEHSVQQIGLLARIGQWFGAIANR